MKTGGLSNMENYEEYKEKQGNRKLIIRYDESPDSPREWSNLGKMVCNHKRYNLPNESDINFDSFSSWDEIEKYLYSVNKAIIVLPIYMYDHSGVCLNTTGFHCPWDSGQVGFIYVTKDALAEEGITEENAKKILEGEVKTYSSYIEGNVFGYQLFDIAKVKVTKIYENGETTETEETEENLVDSCWGYFEDNNLAKEIFEELGLNFEDWEQI